MFDDEGALLGELGASSPAVVMSLPLPIYYCYGQVLLAAARLGLWAVARRAAAALFPRFFTTMPARLLWQAHPVDRFSIQVDQVAAQVPPFLRLLVEAVFAYAGHLGAQPLHVLTLQHDDGDNSRQEEAGAGSTGGLAGTAASRELLLSLSRSRIPQQIALLEAAQRHLMAMQASVGWSFSLVGCFLPDGF